MKQLPSHIVQWLHDRLISDAVIEQYGISWDGHRVVIPVYDQDGNFLFNKYRRDPLTEEGAKYTYDKGATSALFGAQYLSDPVIICEGELDVLALVSNEFSAVSSTGGAQSFLPEWATAFDRRQVFICYDSDEAGVRGGYKVQKLIPHAKTVFLPNHFKDITEFFQAGNTPEVFERLLEEAITLPIPAVKIDELPKARLKELKQHYGGICATLRQQAFDRRYRALSYIIDEFLKEIEKINRLLKKPKRVVPRSDDIASIKQVPISQFVKFDGRGYAPCVWHKEKTPSMHYIPDRNRVKCFGCAKGGDVIDVVMGKYGVSMPEAIATIKKGL